MIGIMLNGCGSAVIEGNNLIGMKQGIVSKNTKKLSINNNGFCDVETGTDITDTDELVFEGNYQYKRGDKKINRTHDRSYRDSRLFKEKILVTLIRNIMMERFS